MSERFYVQPTDQPTIEIADSEARHIGRVMRLGPGDSITLFDGKGKESSATIIEVQKNLVTVQADNWVERSRVPTPEVTIITALPKGDRLKFMIEKLTEIGADRLVPLVTARSNVRPKDNTIAKLQRYVIEACKQCGRNHLMKITEASNFQEALTLPSDQCQKLICDPHGGIQYSPTTEPDAQMCFLIGPEGGFTSEEIGLAQDANWEPIQLGGTILRIETAAMVACLAGCGIFTSKG